MSKWVSPTQSVDGFNRKRTDLPSWEERIITSDHLWTQTAALPWVSNLLAYAVDFEPAKPL